MTNFPPVSASEIFVTFTSTSPAAFPAAMTSASEIVLIPFGRTTHSAPAGASASRSRRSGSRAQIHRMAGALRSCSSIVSAP
jgi:hypothetical protein